MNLREYVVAANDSELTYYRYSGTSNKGPSEIGTTSLQGHLLRHHANVLFYLRDRDNFSTRDKTISHKVSLVRRFQCICMYIVYLSSGRRS